MKNIYRLIVLVAVGLFASNLGWAQDTPDKTKLEQNLSNMPLSFELNQGQHEPQVRFKSQGVGHGVYLTNTETIVHLPKPSLNSYKEINRKRRESLGRLGSSEIDRSIAEATVAKPVIGESLVHLQTLGGNGDPKVIGEEMLKTKSHYLIGADPKNWRRNVPHYAKVRYEQVYPGIDKLYYGTNGALEYDWLVKPSADPAQIHFRVTGADALTLQDDGSLLIQAKGQQFSLKKPVAYVKVGADHIGVDAVFKISASQEVSFQLGEYDHTQLLVIDPVIEFLTTISGDKVGEPLLSSQYAQDFLVDAVGAMYVAGTAPSTYIAGDGLGKKLLADPTGTHAYVMKIGADAKTILQTTYFGGNGADQAISLKLDTSANIYVAGVLGSTVFPVTPMAADNRSVVIGKPNTFVISLVPDGSAIRYAAVMAGITPKALAVDPLGNVYVVGATGTPDLPTTSLAFQSHGYAADPDPSHSNGYMFKLGANDGHLVYATYLTAADLLAPKTILNDVAVDALGNAYVVGSTNSKLFPVTAGAYQTVRGPTIPGSPEYGYPGADNDDGFVVKLNPAGSALVYGTYIGGKLSESLVTVQVDASGRVYFAGVLDHLVNSVFATDLDFPSKVPSAKIIFGPATFASYATTFHTEGFIGRLLADGSGIDFFTFMGGRGNTFYTGINAGVTTINKIKLDAKGRLYFSGVTTGQDLPFANQIYEGPKGDYYVPGAPGVGFFGKLDVNAPALLISSYFGDPTADPEQHSNIFGMDVRQSNGDLYLLGNVGPYLPDCGCGTGIYAGFSNTTIARISKTNVVPIKVTSSINPSKPTQAVSFTAMVGLLTSSVGNVDFLFNGVLSGSTPLVGSAAVLPTAGFATKGVYKIRANYANPPDVDPSFGEMKQYVYLPPTVNITNPITGALFGANTVVIVNVSATADTGLLMGRVELYVNDVLKSTQTSPYSTSYSFATDPLAPGSYTIKVRAYDSVGGSADSPTVTIKINAPPTVSITAPIAGSTYPAAGITLTATSSATTPAAIAKVSYAAGSLLIGTSTTAPYTVNWTAVPVGAYDLIATATDTLGGTGASPPIHIKVTLTGSGETITYLHNDLSGNPVAATDAAGHVQWVESYLPFGGRLLNDPRTANNRQWFQDKPQDAESGLSYFGARYYDPALGRFMATDPQGYDEANLHSFNRYTYGNNNPYRYTDPDGHSPLDIAFLVVDGVQLGRAIYSGAGITEAAINFGMSAVGVISPVPGVGLALKEVRAVVHAADAIKEASQAGEAVRIVEKVTANELRVAGRADFKASRTEALAENGGRCTYCGKPANAGDHVKPLKSFAEDVNAGKISKGDAVRQANAPENITGACTSCNSSKGAKQLSKTEGPGKWVAPNKFHKD